MNSPPSVSVSPSHTRGRDNVLSSLSQQSPTLSLIHDLLILDGNTETPTPINVLLCVCALIVLFCQHCDAQAFVGLSSSYLLVWFYGYATGQRGSPASQVWGQQARWSQEAGGRKWEISWNVRFSPQWSNNSAEQRSSCFCPLSVCTVAPCSDLVEQGEDEHTWEV